MVIIIIIIVIIIIIIIVNVIIIRRILKGSRSQSIVYTSVCNHSGM